MNWDDRYWSVDLQGLDEAGATVIVGVAESLPGVIGGQAVDPRTWLTLHLDRDTVESLAAALRAAPSTTIGASMFQEFDEWLASAD